MRGKYLFFALALVMSFITKAQNVCGTPENFAAEHFEDSTSRFSSSSLCVNVQFHIVRDDYGNSSVTTATIDQLMGILNSHFNPHNIYIRKAGVDFINSSSYYNMHDGLFNQLIQINNNPNAINFYIVNSCSSWDGRAENIIAKNLVMTTPYLLSGVSSHEIGHCLNLWHTFQGTKPRTSGCAENIDGSNCNSCGDYVCDTPADRGDGHQGGYTPDMTNNMSYYTPSSLNHFSVQQGQRMYGALKHSPILRDVVSNCISIEGNDYLCENTEVSYTIQHNVANLSYVWSVSPNLQIVSQNQNTVVIKAIGDGIGGITANFPNGLKATKEVWIGVPKIDDLEFIEDEFQYPTLCKSNEYNANNKIIVNAKGINGNSVWEWSKISSNFHWTQRGNYVNILPYQTGTISFGVRVSNECGVSNWKYYAIPVVNCPRDGMFGEFSVYPNPASEIVTIDLKDITGKSAGFSDVEIIDMHGKVRLKGKIKDKIEFNISELSKGIYFIKINLGDTIETHQLIVK